MKMEEKGIDKTKERMNRGPQPKESGPTRFNAFREMAKEAAGERAWQDTEPQQSKPTQDAPPKVERSDPLTLEFNGKSLTTRPDGTVDPDEVTFPAQSVLTFEGAGENGNWRDLKVRPDSPAVPAAGT